MVFPLNSVYIASYHAERGYPTGLWVGWVHGVVQSQMKPKAASMAG